MSTATELKAWSVLIGVHHTNSAFFFRNLHPSISINRFYNFSIIRIDREGNKKEERLARRRRRASGAASLVYYVDRKRKSSEGKG